MWMQCSFGAYYTSITEPMRFKNGIAARHMASPSWAASAIPPHAPPFLPTRLPSQPRAQPLPCFGACEGQSLCGRAGSSSFYFVPPMPTNPEF